MSTLDEINKTITAMPNRFAGFLISEERFVSVKQELGIEETESKDFGFVYIEFKGVKILFNEDVANESVIPLEISLIEFLR